MRRCAQSVQRQATEWHIAFSSQPSSCAVCPLLQPTLFSATARSRCSRCGQTGPAFVTFVTAGYPTVQDTVPILLAMQEGGSDVIELGVPFSDPMADGPAIQETNAVRPSSFRSRLCRALRSASTFAVTRPSLCDSITYIPVQSSLRQLPRFPILPFPYAPRIAWTRIYALPARGDSCPPS